MTPISLVPIREKLSDNDGFIEDPECRATLEMSVLYYAKVGYSVPWIGYYARMGDTWVGNAGFKGRPIGGRVEIAYGTFPSFQKMGIGTEICRQLVQLAKVTDPGVTITARTLMEENYSVKILRRNSFKWNGVVVDPDDGEVWEWEYIR